jgi:tRNA A-37 threonylcarbamoyl transferase component Bud32
VSSSDTARDFLTVAGQLALLAPETAHDLVREATARNIAPSQLALQKGLLSAVQVDIVETLLRPEETVPGYEILSVIGHGGMGVVYRARQKNLNRVVALKTVLVSQMADPGAVQRFEQEALAVGRLQHPNVITAHDFGRHEGRLFFAMELVEGEDLQQLIHRSGRLDEATAWALARQAAAGLAHAQQQGIVHRDIKPANLLLVPPPDGFPLPPGVPMVKIADFGLAFLASDAEARTRLTSANSTVGSPHYVAPELLSGITVDFRADVYSLGATVYHMLAGRPPFAGLAMTQILTRKVNQESPSLAEEVPGLAEATVSLVAEMMARDPAGRTPSYGRLIKRIDGILPLVAGRPAMLGPMGDRGTVEGSDTLIGRATTKTLPMSAAARSRSKRRLLLLGLAVAAVVAATLLWAYWPPKAVDLPPRDMVPGGWSDYLFGGKSIDGWFPRGGQWSMVQHEEGNVISGESGVFRRTFPWPGDPAGLANYRLAAAFRLHQADAVEFHFGVLAGPGSDGPRYVLRITPDGAVLGERPSDRGPFTARSEKLPAKIDPARLYGVEIERQHGYWFVMLDTTKTVGLVGALPVRAEQELLEIRLVAEGESGPAFFSDIELHQLKPREPESKLPTAGEVGESEPSSRQSP